MLQDSGEGSIVLEFRVWFQGEVVFPAKLSIDENKKNHVALFLSSI